MASCIKVLNALSDCQRKHPHEAGYVCAHLQRAAGWCLFRQACPDEGERGPLCCTWRSILPGSATRFAPPVSWQLLLAAALPALKTTPAGLVLLIVPSSSSCLLLPQWMHLRPAPVPAAGARPLQGRLPSLAGATSRSVGRGRPGAECGCCGDGCPPSCILVVLHLHDCCKPPRTAFRGFRGRLFSGGS